MTDKLDNLVLEHLRQMREWQERTDVKFETVLAEIRAINGSIRGMLQILSTHQDIDGSHGTRLDSLEKRIAKLESLNNRIDT